MHDQTKKMRWAGHVAYMGEGRCLLRKPEGNRQRRRKMRRWEDNIKMDLQEVGLRHVMECSGSG